jgi:alkane 1-monooxygenase
MKIFPYFIFPFITIACYFALEQHPFIFVIIIYSILPLADEIISMDWKNPTKDERKAFENDDIWFKLVLYFTAIADWMLFFKIMDIFFNYEFTPFNVLNLMGIIYVFLTLQAAQFTIAHEIFHKQNFFDRFFGTIHMSKVLYMHFTYEHIWGHHKKVATAEDPASA